MPKLTQADIANLEGRRLGIPILVVSSCSAIGLCWLLSVVTPLPFGDLLFILAVSGYAAFEMHRSGKTHADVAALPMPVSAGSRTARPQRFREYLSQRHELLGLFTKGDKRVRAMALGVGGIVMLVWRIFGAQIAESGAGVARSRFQIEGWVFTLFASKVTKFLTRRAMVAAVRLSSGAAWVPLKLVSLTFCCSVVGVLMLFGQKGDRLSIFRQWLAQWMLALTLVEVAWCYIRWQLWGCIAAKIEARLAWWMRRKNDGNKCS